MWLSKALYVNPMINEDDSYCLFIDNDEEGELVDIPKEVFEKIYYKLNDIEEEYVQKMIKMEKENFFNQTTPEQFAERFEKSPNFEFMKEILKSRGISKEKFIEETKEKMNYFGLTDEYLTEEKISKVYDKLME